MKNLVFLAFFAPCILFSVELRYLFEENNRSPKTIKERALVKHVQKSYQNAIVHKSKLNTIQFSSGMVHRNAENPDFTTLKDLNAKPYFHLLNNLCSLKKASHLHVGLLAGDSFIAALSGNQKLLKDVVGLDWFQECPKDTFLTNCQKYLDMSQCVVLNGDCFNIDKSIFKKPINIFLYDADHSLKAHEKALTYFDDIFSDLFVVVIDDWECPWIRKPTFCALKKLGHEILYENFIPGPRKYRSGQYVAVIKK